jgi:GAF domain-containing protein
MVEEFGFSPEEVDRHTKTARSYLAFPIRDRGDMVGVMYFFSTEPQVFPVAANEDRLRDAAESISALLRAAEIL